MGKTLFKVCLCFCILFVMTTQAFAQSKKYIIAPFQINGNSEYNYLSEAFPSMLTSRLFQSGMYENVESSDVAIIKSAVEAQSTLDSTMADYLIYGSITMIGSSASIDMTGLTKDGEKWQHAVNTNIDSLISSIQPISDSVNSEFFTLTPAVSSQTSTISSEIQSPSSIVTPDSSRTQSQPLHYTATTMDIGNFTGNGESDIVIGDNARTVTLYSWNGGAMIPRASYRTPSSQRILSVRTIWHDNQELIALTCFNETQVKAITTLLAYDGKALNEYMSLPFFVNTIVLPDTNREILIGQYNGTSSVFRGEIFEVLLTSNKEWEKGAKLTGLPRRANVYNFTYFPADRSIENNVVMLSAQEKLLVSDPVGQNIANVDELYSGGSAYISTIDGSPTGGGAEMAVEFFYIPMRMIYTDLNNDEYPEIIANHPITTIGEYLKNFRGYSESEIHALTWDGLGLSMAWKTPTINGTVADFQIADVDNDGIDELIVGVVTSSGVLGLGSGRTVITLMDLPTN